MTTTAEADTLIEVLADSRRVLDRAGLYLCAWAVALPAALGIGMALAFLAGNAS